MTTYIADSSILTTAKSILRNLEALAVTQSQTKGSEAFKGHYSPVLDFVNPDGTDCKTLDDVAAVLKCHRKAAPYFVLESKQGHVDPELWQAAQLELKKKPPGGFTGAYIMAKVSDDDAKRLAVKGGEDPADLHVTLGFFAQPAASYDNAQRLDIERNIANALPNTPLPFTANATAIIHMNPNGGDDQEPCACLMVQSQALHDIHEAIQRSCEGQWSTKFPTWIPHVTLGYNIDPASIKDKLGPIKFDQIVIGWGSDQVPIAPGGKFTKSLESKVRHVASQSGVDRFHAPIGTPIGKNGLPIGQVTAVAVHHEPGNKKKHVVLKTRKGDHVAVHPGMDSANNHIDTVLDANPKIGSIHHVVGKHQFQMAHDGTLKDQQESGRYATVGKIGISNSANGGYTAKVGTGRASTHSTLQDALEHVAQTLDGGSSADGTVQPDGNTTTGSGMGPTVGSRGTGKPRPVAKPVRKPSADAPPKKRRTGMVKPIAQSPSEGPGSIGQMISVNSPEFKGMSVDSIRKIHMVPLEKTDGKYGRTPDGRKAIPPGWTNVVIATSPDFYIQAYGLDSMGRPQQYNSLAWDETQATKKHARVEAVRKAMPKLDKYLDTQRTNESDTAAVVFMMRHWGVRVDSTQVKKAGTTVKGHTAYGATTLQMQHVKFTDKGVEVDFIGKSNVLNHYESNDPQMIQLFRVRTIGKKPGDSLFDTDDKKTILLLRHILNVPGVKNHDMRTHFATMHAADMIKNMASLPTTQEQFENDRDMICEKVAKAINDTKQVAYEKYLAPSVWLILQSKVEDK